MKLWNLAGACAMVTGVTSVPVLAACQWEWLCNGDGSGGCKHMPVCETLYDTPPPRPESAPPAPPPISMRPHKIAGSLGPATCEFILHQTQTGRWEWDRACFCNDPARTIDPNAPLANIVRCDPPWKE